MNVELSEGNCIFKFDYSKVYWNTRLQTEHKRLIEIFQPGEVVCDVMAGIGPFAVPAGKKGVFVYANDLNPESYEALKAAITRNKVSMIHLLPSITNPSLQVASFVSPFCQDGRTFIHYAADHLLSLTTTNTNTIAYPAKRTTHGPPAHLKPLQLITIPPTISHFVLNLPATAISFLPSFIGLYHNQEKYFIPNTTTKLPLIHVHCFSTKSEDNVRETKEICERISKELGVKMEPWSGKEKGGEWEGVKVHDVRDVAPMKRMFCASFRLPAEVAFRERVV
jgi:tRNA (guanine37-N1)-methyltransferase